MSSDTEAPLLDLSITNCIVSPKIYDKRDVFKFEKLIFHFLMEMLPMGFLASLPILYTFLNLFVLREYALMLMTSTTETII